MSPSLAQSLEIEELGTMLNRIQNVFLIGQVDSLHESRGATASNVDQLVRVFSKPGEARSPMSSKFPVVELRCQGALTQSLSELVSGRSGRASEDVR